MLGCNKLRFYFSSDRDTYQAIKNIFGYCPGNIHLYKLALRHKSASTKRLNGLKLNNERLEYLGDAILSAIIADYLFKAFPYENEGFLTEMRSKIVSRAALNKLSHKLGLNLLIKSGKESTAKAKSAGGDAFEAIIGALYLDKGYSITKKILITRIVNLHFDIDLLIETEISYKSKLNEWAQKGKHDIKFTVEEEIGEKHKKQYLVSVEIDGQSLAKSQDYSIKGAENLAAEKAWNVIEKNQLT
ncbi:MAG: ribonuclease III [Lentimicrobiaceae bacterium]|nr:ribonuclease III [Lentimicrobiaceae bacterium]MCP4910985.1 ribonuclease III [Bacteroidota bacterium]MBT3454338.1 ribonuclease III [Lentimicrobiaceae bacterium]MBT3817938.1 ribonuclease III [Lentimicrobiaceae bacterium]MBT4061556.1 ribonuclease III [Lentimicrobiaceae bacterium]